MRVSHLLVLALCFLALLVPSSWAQDCTDVCPCTDCNQVEAFECRRVPGDLIFTDGSPVVNLPCLEEVGGDLLIENTDLSIINLWTLRLVEGDFVMADNPDLDILNIPTLARVGGRIVVRGDHGELDELRFLSLISVGHSISVFGEETPEYLG